MLQLKIKNEVGIIIAMPNWPKLVYDCAIDGSGEIGIGEQDGLTT